LYDTIDCFVHTFSNSSGWVLNVDPLFVGRLFSDRLDQIPAVYREICIEDARVIIESAPAERACVLACARGQWTQRAL